MRFRFLLPGQYRQNIPRLRSMQTHRMHHHFHHPRTPRSTAGRIGIIHMNGLVKDFSPGVVIILVAHTDEMRANGQAGNIQVLGQDGFDLGIKRPVLCLKGGTVSFPGSVSTKYSAAEIDANPPDDHHSATPATA